MTIDFCLPVKDEENILALNANRLYNYLLSLNLSYDWKIVVLVNGSSDSSWKIAQDLEFSNDHFQAEFLELGGKGRALKTYFNKSQADILIFMDIDLAVSLNSLPGLIQSITAEPYDLVIGSRLVVGAHTDRSFWRSFTSHCYNFLSRLVLGHKFFDLQCGFKAIKRPLFNKLPSQLMSDSWFFDTELVIFSTFMEAKVKELPVDWQENRYDERKSKIRVVRDAWSFIFNLLLLRYRLGHLKR